MRPDGLDDGILVCVIVALVGFVSAVVSIGTIFVPLGLLEAIAGIRSWLSSGAPSLLLSRICSL
jgi:hypothetical protein